MRADLLGGQPVSHTLSQEQATGNSATSLSSSCPGPCFRLRQAVCKETLWWPRSHEDLISPPDRRWCNPWSWRTPVCSK